MAETRTDLGKIFITNGGTYDATVTYEKLTMVSYNNSTYITLRTVTGVTPSDDRVNYLLMAQGFTATYLASVTAIDQQGIATEAGDEISAQLLINAIADRVANQLVSNDVLQDTLLDYVAKSAVTPSLNVTEDGKVLDAKAGKALNDALTPIIVSVTSSHTNYIQCFKVGRLRILYGNVVLTSAVSAWSSAVFELSNAADRPLYTNIVVPIANASSSGEYLEIIYNTGKAQASKAFASGTQLKFAACWISQG